MSSDDKALFCLSRNTSACRRQEFIKLIQIPVPYVNHEEQDQSQTDTNSQTLETCHYILFNNSPFHSDKNTGRADHILPRRWEYLDVAVWLIKYSLSYISRAGYSLKESPQVFFLKGEICCSMENYAPPQKKKKPTEEVTVLCHLSVIQSCQPAPSICDWNVLHWREHTVPFSWLANTFKS